MSTSPVAGATSAEHLAPPWAAVAERVRAYLETAGLKSSAAVELAREIVTRPGAPLSRRAHSR